MATMTDKEFGNLIGSDKVEGSAVYGERSAACRARSSPRPVRPTRPSRP